MPLQTKTYEQFLSDIVTTWASLLYLSPNLRSGDPLLAVFQSVVLGGLIFVQSQAVRVNKLTRAATSDGPDLDSWMNDFSFPRKPAQYASGTVQFSVNRVLNSVVKVPIGAIIQTKDATIQYQVVVDTTKTAYSPTDNAYILPANDLSIDVQVQAVEPGASQNVQVGALSQIVSTMTGINNVTNLAPIENGQDPEVDDAYRSRFKLFINSVNGKATPGGILSAALDVPGVVAAALIENQDQYGTARRGYGVVVVDDGSGAPSSTLLNTVFEAIFQAVRGFTIGFVVVGPTKVSVNIALNIRINPAAQNPSQVQLNATNAVIDYVNSLQIGEELYLENLAYVAKFSDPVNVLSVQPGSTKINNSAADLIVSPQSVIRTDNTRTNIGTY